MQDLNSDFTLKNCLFGGVNLAKNADLDKYICSSYGIGFDLCSELSLPDSSAGKNAIIFGVDWEHIGNNEKYILIICKGTTQRSDDTTLTAEAQYSINFSRSNLLNLILFKNFFFLLMLQK